MTNSTNKLINKPVKQITDFGKFKKRKKSVKEEVKILHSNIRISITEI